MGTTYLTDGDDLTSVANAIRAKSGGSGQLAFPSGFVSEIGNIPSGGTRTLQKLAECTIDSPINAVQITATDAMKSCDQLYVYFDFTLSAADWIYPYVNASTGSYFTNKTTRLTMATVLTLTPAATINGTTIPRYWNFAKTLGTGTGSSGHEFSSFNLTGFKPYASATNIVSGSVEIWGYV